MSKVTQMNRAGQPSFVPSGRGRNDARMQEERQLLTLALMNRPWITKQSDGEMYALARDHYETLRDWFHEQTGWSLMMTRHFVKLEKIPGQFQSWMAFRGFRDARDYGLFTYGLWYLEGLGEKEQFLLSEMVETIREHLLGMDVSMEWTLYEHRLSMSRALRKLRELGVLVAVEGDETEWARAGGETNVLYEASPLARYVLRRFARDLMSYQTMDDLIRPDDLQTAQTAQTQYQQPQAGHTQPRQPQQSQVGHTHYQQPQVGQGGEADPSGQQSDAISGSVVARRHQVIRRLLEEPVVYDWQWTEDERRYVQTQRGSLMDRIGQATGLEGRRFREGLVFVWTDLSSEMEMFPTQAAISDLVMLLAGELRRALNQDRTRYDRDDQQNLMLTRSEFEALLIRLRTRYGEYWSKEHREKTSRQLGDDLLAHLAEWNLGQEDGLGGVRLFPAVVRWNADYQWEDENA